MEGLNVTVREAKREDCRAIMAMSKEIADYHEDYDYPQIEVRVLERDLFDAENSSIGIFVAEIDGNVIGYTHYFYTYDVKFGKGMYLEDIYVKEKFRNLKVGDKLMKAVAKLAVEQDLHKIELVVANWNRAVHFYERLGAINYSETKNLHWFTIEKSDIAKIASTAS